MADFFDTVAHMQINVNQRLSFLFFNNILFKIKSFTRDILDMGRLLMAYIFAIFLQHLKRILNNRQVAINLFSKI